MVGLGTVSSDYAVINDDSLCSGIVNNPNYTGTDNEPQYYLADKKFTYVKDCTDIKNYIKILALLSNGSTLTRQIFRATGHDTYTLAQKAADIKHIARYIDCKVVTKTNTTTGTIGSPEAAMIGIYDARFTANGLGGQLYCAITCQADNIEYVRPFTISGTTFTLGSAIANLAANDRFELINAYDILKTGVEETTGLPVTAKGYVIKNIQLGAGDSTFKFSPYDVPGKVGNTSNERVICYYNALSDYQPQLIFDDSINRYDIYAVTEDLSNIPLTSAQVDLLIAEYQKYVVPLETITLVTCRPTIPEIGWQIPVNVTNVCTGTFNVIDVSYKWIHPYGQVAGKPFQEVTVVLANYQKKLGQILAGLKRQSSLAKAQLDQLYKHSNITNLNIIVEWGDTEVVPGPLNLVLTDFTLPTATISWDALSGAEEYRIYGSKYADFSTLRKNILGVNYCTDKVYPPLHTYTDINLLSGNTYYYKVSAIVGAVETVVSNTVNTGMSEQPGIPQANLLAYYTFNNTLADATGTYADAVLVSNATVNTGKLDIPGDNTSYATIPVGILNGRTAFTISGWITLDGAVGDCAIISGENDTQTNAFEMFYSYATSNWNGLFNNVGGGITTVVPKDTNQHFTAFVWDGVDIKLYLDDSYIGSDPMSGTMEIDDLKIGIDQADTGGALRETLNGKTMNMAFYSAALDATTIAQLKTDSTP